MARVLEGSHFTCTPTRSSAIGMSHTCLCLPSYSWYSFTNSGWIEGGVGLGGWLRNETVYLPEGRRSHPSYGFNVEQLRCSRPTRYRHTKPPHMVRSFISENTLMNSNQLQHHLLPLLASRLRHVPAAAADVCFCCAFDKRRSNTTRHHLVSSLLFSAIG